MAYADSSRNALAKITVATGAASDNFVPICVGTKGVVFTGVRTTNATANMSTSTATIGVNTGAAAGGNVIVTAATGTHTSLTAATKYTDCTIASPATTDVQTLSVANAPATYNGAANGQAGVYVRVAGTPNVTGNVDVYIYGDVLI